MLFGKTAPGYGLSVEPRVNKIRVSIRKGHAACDVVLDPTEARKLARELYKIVKEVES